MKQFLLILLQASILTLAGCSKNDGGVDYSKDILGMWLSAEVDGKPILTNDMFVNIFSADGKGKFGCQVWQTAIGSQDTSIAWIESSDGYTLQGDILEENGIEFTGETFYCKSKISFKDNFSYVTVLNYVIDGVDDPSYRQPYTMQKVSVDYSSQILGVWKGHETTQGTTPPTHDVYWQYFADGSYNYYYYDNAQQKYVQKADNEGEYFIYGNLFASNYTNDIGSGASGKNSECWMVSIDGNHMSWTATREHGLTASFEMDRAELPNL